MVEKNHFDSKKIYCRQLGHEVPFGYCRRPGSPAFCRNIIGCWMSKIDINQFLRDHYSLQEIEEALRPPKPKIQTLYSLIQEAQARQSENESEKKET